MEELQQQFDGIGEVRGYSFRQVKQMPFAFIYEVLNGENGDVHYEVFKRKEVNKYDFETQTQLDEMKVRYPKAHDFGVWAWTTETFQQAEIRLELLNKYELQKNR